MPTAYRIRNWDMHFENSESRKVKHVRWVPTPNRFDGKGFRRLAKKSNASDIFSGWVLMFQAASRMPVRGLLVDEDGPLTVDDLSDMTGFARNVFVAAVEALVGWEINWLEEVEYPETPGQSPGTSGDAGVEGREGREGKAAAGAAVAAAAAVLKLGVFDEAFAAWATTEYPPERVEAAVKVYAVRAADPDPKRRPRNPAGLFRKLLADGCTPPSPPPMTKGYPSAPIPTPPEPPSPPPANMTPEGVEAGHEFLNRRKAVAQGGAS